MNERVDSMSCDIVDRDIVERDIVEIVERDIVDKVGRVKSSALQALMHMYNQDKGNS